MSHPSLGLPAPDRTRGHPEAAERLRREAHRLAPLALEATLAVAPHFRDRYDELDLRRFLNDFGQHIERLARAMETNDDSFVTNYAEWLVPVYRRRGVPMKDFGYCIEGLRAAAGSALAPSDAAVANVYLDRWLARLKHHRALPGDHKGNSIVRFFWKGAGVLDDSIV